MVNIEICCNCNSPTGTAGRQDDSLYFGDTGPFCEGCYDDIYCNNCEGSGEVFVKRNNKGEVDYIDGSPTGETTRCDVCRGEGMRP